MAPALTARCEVWLMRLGVKMLHGRPYHPQTQGKDKRFHRTLYVELLQARRFADLAECQSRFETWRRIYTEQRPHEALNLAPPCKSIPAKPGQLPRDPSRATMRRRIPDPPRPTGRLYPVQRTKLQAIPGLHRTTHRAETNPNRWNLERPLHALSYRQHRSQNSG